MSRKFVLACALVAAVLLVLFPLQTLHAQYDNGSLVGVIRDSSGAPVVGAEVTILNTATGISTNLRTDGAGQYNDPELRAGVYTVTAAATGFAKSVAQDITVSVGEIQRINLTLSLGATETTIQVTGVSLAPETETSERDQIITNYESEAFPSVTRNYSDLLA